MTPKNKIARSPLPVLTSLRFFAASNVVVQHFFPFKPDSFLHSLAESGYHAVTFFFVLSGFILSYVYSGEGREDGIAVTPAEFWKARFARIMPAYWVGLIIAAPFFLYMTFVSHLISIPAFLVTLVLVLLLLQSWWPPLAYNWNPAAWSLSVEVFLYAVFTPVMALGTRLSFAWFFLLAAALGIVTWFLQVTFLPGGPNGLGLFAILFPLFHLPQFILGIVASRSFLFGKSAGAGLHASVFAASGLAVLLILGLRHVLPLWAHSNLVLGFLYAAVIWGAAGAGRYLKLLAAPPLIFLGEISYAIYILHLPMLSWWVWLVKVLKADLSGPAAFAIFFSAVVVLSTVVFVYIEKPMRRRILGRLPHKMS